MRSRIFLCLCILALGVSACADPTTPESDGDPSFQRGADSAVTFRTTESTYEVGDTATIILRNGTSRTVGFNLCGSARELRENAGWVRYESLRVCAAVLHPLAPGAEVTLLEPITDEWKPGQYRMTTRIWHSDTNAADELFTAPFTIAD